MMYSNKFVCSVKVEGKILRENNGSVSLPFGSEYGLLLKNLNSRRAMVKVSVDGQDATEGTKLILPTNGSIDLERFIRDGNLQSGNRFKFIERTEQIENHREIKENDGLVRAEFWAEKEILDVPVVRKHYYDEYVPYWPEPCYPTYPTYPIRPTPTYGSLQRSSGGVRGSSRSLGAQGATGGIFQSMNCSTQSFNMSETSANDAGITVPGSESHQSFQSVSGFNLESNSTVIVLQLKGVAGNQPVSKAITVDFKPTCQICGKKNTPLDNFCRGCGTSMRVF